MGLLDFLKKDDDNASKDIENKDETPTTEGGHDKVLHAMDTPEAVPQALKDTLAKIRGEQEPDVVEVEVDEQGNALNPEQADLLKTGSVATDGDTTSGDADIQSDAGQETPESEDVDGSAASDEVDLSDLDSRLVEAGKKMGWDDEKISLIAHTDLTILEDIASRQESSQSHRREDKDDTDGADDTSSGQAANEALAKIKEKLGDDADDLIALIAQGVEKKFEGRLKQVDDFAASEKQRTENEAALQRGRIADELMDKAGEVFEEIGNSKELPTDGDGRVNVKSPVMKVRGAIYTQALRFHAANGGSFEQAVSDALQHYAGGRGTEIAARQVVKDLNKNKTRFSPKPTRRRTVKVFKSDKDKAAHIVKDAKRKAGIE